MTIHSTRRTSSDFEVGTQYLTSDGKLITLKHVCIEENRPRIDISDAKKGDTFVLRCGEKFVCKGELYSDGSIRSWRGVDPDGRILYFRFNGYCPSFGADMEVVELIRAPEPRVSLEGLQVGDRFRVRNGCIFTCARLDSYGSPIWAKSDTPSDTQYFGFDGRSCPACEELEAVERLTPVKPRVSLEDLQVGGRFRTRHGQVFACTSINKNSAHGIYAASEKDPHLRLYFLRNGKCNLDDPSLEAVEILESSVVESIRFQLQKLDKAKVNRIIVSEKEWRKLEAEVGRASGEAIRIDEVEVFYSSNSFEMPPGEYDIRMKLN